MLRKLIESFTTLTGSVRGDAKLLSGRIARRCAVAFELCGHERFDRMRAQALITREVVEDTGRCTDNQARVILKMLIEMEKEMAQLQQSLGIRDKIGDILEGRET